MKNATRNVGTSLAILLFAACHGNLANEQPVDFNQLFAERYVEPFNTKDMERWADAFSADAVGMHNGLPPLEGREAIFGFGDAVRNNFDTAYIDATIDEVRYSGSWTWTRGTYVSTFVPKPGIDGLPSGRQAGKFLLLWERQPDGEWKIIMDMGNSSGPPGPP